MLFKLINFLFEVPDKVKGFYFKNFYNNYTKKVELRSDYEYSRYAIVCIYDKNPRSDLIALFGKLKKSGFGIIAILSNDADTQYGDMIDIKVHLLPVGRDFLAYQQGYKVLKKFGHLDTVKSVCFLNDSVWYFKKHQEKLICELVESVDRGNLTSGTMIFDDIPHLSGWFFGVKLTENTIADLDKLFAPNFARKSREYNIREGEHKIITRLSSIDRLKNLDENGPARPYAYCYTAVSEGLECFYLKADANLRTNPAKSQLEKFLRVNASDEEYMESLSWIISKSDSLFNSPLRRAEMYQFRKYYFEN
jgi:hypothetical protein